MGVVDLTCPSVHADGVQRIDRKLELSQNQSLRNGSKFFTKFVSPIYLFFFLLELSQIYQFAPNIYIYIYKQFVRFIILNTNSPSHYILGERCISTSCDQISKCKDKRQAGTIIS